MVERRLYWDLQAAQLSSGGNTNLTRAGRTRLAAFEQHTG